MKYFVSSTLVFIFFSISLPLSAFRGNNYLHIKDRVQNVDSFQTIQAYKLICSEPLIFPNNLNDNEFMKNLCEIVGNSELCQDIKKEDKKDCSINLKDEFTNIQDYYSCLRGFVGSVVGFISETALFIYSLLSSKEKIIELSKEAVAAINSLSLYFEAEKMMVMKEIKGPFKESRAEFIVIKNLINKILESILTYFKLEYAKYSCLNQQAKFKYSCEAISELIVPIGSFYSLLKAGPKAMRLQVRKIIKTKNEIKIKAPEDKKRIKDASEILLAKGQRPLNLVQQKAILNAHEVGRGEPGKNGHSAKVGNYSWGHIRKKNQILRSSGLNSIQIRLLMENGIVGDTDSLDLNKIINKTNQRIEEGNFIPQKSLVEEVTRATERKKQTPEKLVNKFVNELVQKNPHEKQLAQIQKELLSLKGSGKRFSDRYMELLTQQHKLKYPYQRIDLDEAFQFETLTKEISSAGTLSQVIQLLPRVEQIIAKAKTKRRLTGRENDLIKALKASIKNQIRTQRRIKNQIEFNLMKNYHPIQTSKELDKFFGKNQISEFLKISPSDLDDSAWYILRKFGQKKKLEESSSLTNRLNEYIKYRKLDLELRKLERNTRKIELN